VTSKECPGFRFINLSTLDTSIFVDEETSSSSYSDAQIDLYLLDAGVPGLVPVETIKASLSRELPEYTCYTPGCLTESGDMELRAR
jgi:hypothetical protein